jgi:hypothetical protein
MKLYIFWKKNDAGLLADVTVTAIGNFHCHTKGFQTNNIKD